MVLVKKCKEENDNRASFATEYRLSVNKNNQLSVDSISVYKSTALQIFPNVLFAKQQKQYHIDPASKLSESKTLRG